MAGLYKNEILKNLSESIILEHAERLPASMNTLMQENKELHKEVDRLTKTNNKWITKAQELNALITVE